MKARGVALALAALAGILVLLPIPLMDLAMMLPIQLLIGLAVRRLSGRQVAFLSLLPLVAIYGLLGSALGLALEIFLPILGKLLLAPFAFVWCYLFAELAMLLAPPKAAGTGLNVSQPD